MNNSSNLRLYFLFFIIFVIKTPLFSQHNSAFGIYVKQYIELNKNTDSLFAEIKNVSQKSLSFEEINRLREGIFALQKLVHRLHETVLESEQNKSSLLIVQGCVSLDFVLIALDNFLYSKDLLFLLFAKDGKKLVESINKFLE